MPQITVSADRLNIPIDVLLAIVRDPNMFEAMVMQWVEARDEAIAARVGAQELIDQSQILQRDADQRQKDMDAREAAWNKAIRKREAQAEARENALEEDYRVFGLQKDDLTVVRERLDKRDAEQNFRSEQLDRREDNLKAKEDDLAVRVVEFDQAAANLKTEKAEFYELKAKFDAVFNNS